MKSLILAGGRGNRINEFLNNKNKCMVELSGRPLIEYNLAHLLKIDVSEIVIVVGYKAEDIINAVGTNYEGIPIKYSIQQEQKGLVHAIEVGKEAIEKDDFLLILGDEFLPNPRHYDMIDKFYNEDLFAICGVVRERDIKKIGKTYTIIQGNEDNRIYRLIEKPKTALSNFMGTGNCVFRNDIFSYIKRTPINQERSEKELPDLIQCSIDDGKIVKSFIISDHYVNINSEKNLQEAEKLLRLVK